MGWRPSKKVFRCSFYRRWTRREWDRTLGVSHVVFWSWDLLYFKGRRLVVGLAVGSGWQLVGGGGWRLAVGSWWRLVAVGSGWRLVVPGGCRCGLSLTKKKIRVLKASPDGVWPHNTPHWIAPPSSRAQRPGVGRRRYTGGRSTRQRTSESARDLGLLGNSQNIGLCRETRPHVPRRRERHNADAVPGANSSEARQLPPTPVRRVAHGRGQGGGSSEALVGSCVAQRMSGAPPVVCPSVLLLIQLVCLRRGLGGRQVRRGVLDHHVTHQRCAACPGPWCCWCAAWPAPAAFALGLGKGWGTRQHAANPCLPQTAPPPWPPNEEVCHPVYPGTPRGYPWIKGIGGL